MNAYESFSLATFNTHMKDTILQWTIVISLRENNSGCF